MVALSQHFKDELSCDFPAFNIYLQFSNKKNICEIKIFTSYLHPQMKINNTYNSWWHTIN
jgi:hypothetical protein